jgi:hypothetical protein
MNLYFVCSNFNNYVNFNVITIFRKVITYFHTTNAMTWVHFTNQSLKMTGLVETCSYLSMTGPENRLSDVLK